MSTIKIPGYLFKEKLGAGAMGYVYRAQQMSLDRPVAIKILSPTLSADAQYISRFLRETRAIAKLRHENIVAGIDAGEINGVYYLIMEFVEGETLKSMLKRSGRIPEQRAVDLASQIARALDHIAAHGLVHRDIKPSNILVTKDAVAKLCDLGLAKNSAVDPSLTMTGTSMGTPHYMSPEQARGEEDIDIRSDIYSLGATLYHMATGFTPFHGETAMALLAKHVGENLVPPIERNREVGEGLNVIILKMLEKKRERRYRTPAELLAALERLKEQPRAKPAATSDPRTTTPRTPVRTTAHRPSTVYRSRRTAAPAIAAVAVVTLAIFGYLIFNGEYTGKSDRPPRNSPRNESERIAAAHQRDLESHRIMRSAFDDDPQLNRSGHLWSFLSECSGKYRDTPFADHWKTRLNEFESVIDATVETEWAPRRETIETHLSHGRPIDALIEIERFPERARYYQNEPKQAGRTRAGVECDSLRSRAMEMLARRFDTDRRTADAAVKSEQYLKAWSVSYDMELYVTPLTPELRDRMLAFKTDIARDEIAKMFAVDPPSFHQFGEIRSRIDELRMTNRENRPLTALLDDRQKELERRENDHRERLRQERKFHEEVFAGKFAWHMFLRDYASARLEIAAFLDTQVDQDLMDSLFSPGVDLSGVAAMMHRDAGLPPAAAQIALLDDLLRKLEPEAEGSSSFDVVLNARTTLLMEDLMEKAATGLGYIQNPENKEALTLTRQPVPGRSVTGVDIDHDQALGGLRATLRFADGGERVTIPFARRRGDLFFPDEEMAVFARRSCAPSKGASDVLAQNDVRLNLQCGLLLLYAGMPSAALKELQRASGGGSQADRFIRKAESMRKRIPRDPTPSVTTSFAVPCAAKGNAIQVDYAFKRPSEADDWFRFLIPYSRGTVELRDGKLVCRGSIGVVWKAPLRGDVTVELDITFLKGDDLTILLHVMPSREQNTGYGIVPFNESSDDAYAHALFRQPIDYSSDMQNRRTTCVSAPGSRLLNLKPSQTCRLKIERAGDAITLSIDGKKAAFGRDQRSNAGLFGFRTWITDIAVDNVRITGSFN